MLNFLGFCLSRKAFISSSFLKDSFSKKKKKSILDRQVVFLNVLCSFLQGYNIFSEKSVDNIEAPLYIES